MVSKRRGLTLIELVILVVVLAVLGAVGYLRVTSIQLNARFALADERFDSFKRAIQLYNAEWHAFPPDARHDQFPRELRTYINQTEWNEPPPIGARWDWNGPPAWSDNGFNLAIWDDTQPRAMWRKFDVYADDGSTYEGNYRIWDNSLYTPLTEARGEPRNTPNDRFTDASPKGTDP